MVAIELTDKELAVYKSLQANTEGSTGDGWRQVYLDNARPEGMPPRTFAAILGSLEKKGLYRSQGDDCFGDVRAA